MLGLATFLVGLALLLFTFKLAYDMFMVPPEKVLPITKQDAIQLGPLGSTVTALILRVLLLIVMGVVGSLIANRGIHLYTESRGLVRETVEESSRVEPEAQ